MHRCPPVSVTFSKNDPQKCLNTGDIVQSAYYMREHLAELCIENKNCPSYNDSIVNYGF